MLWFNSGTGCAKWPIIFTYVIEKMWGKRFWFCHLQGKELTNCNLINNIPLCIQSGYTAVRKYIPINEWERFEIIPQNLILLHLDNVMCI